MKQQNLTFASHDNTFKEYWKEENRKHHGGTHSIGKRKTRRPLSGKKPVHLVMRSEIARGAISLRNIKNRNKITEIIDKYAKRFDIRIYECSINSNHIHIGLRARTRKSFQDFLRTVAGLIARHILLAERGRKKGKFWASLAFTRVGEWGKAFKTLKNYIVQNILEASGAIQYRQRKKKILSG